MEEVTTKLEDSIYGHVAGFSADRAMDEKRVVEIQSIQIIFEEVLIHVKEKKSIS